MGATHKEAHSPGRRVYDRNEGPGTSLVIVETRDTPCEEWRIPGTEQTVADFNDTYPADASVCVAAFAASLYDPIPDWESMEPAVLAAAIHDAGVKTYSYPVPRLRPYETDDSSLVPSEVTTYFELICYQHARLIQLAAGVEEFGFLWTKYEDLVSGEIEMASITKENMYQLRVGFGVCTYCGEESETQYTRSGINADRATAYTVDGSEQWTFAPPSNNAWPEAATTDHLVATAITADSANDSFYTVYSVDSSGEAAKSFGVDTLFDALGLDGTVYLADGESNLLALPP